MTPEQAASYINAQAVAAHIEALGMQAENAQRVTENKALAYGEEAFASLIDRYGLSHNSIINFFQNNV